MQGPARAQHLDRIVVRAHGDQLQHGRFRREPRQIACDQPGQGARIGLREPRAGHRRIAAQLQRQRAQHVQGRGVVIGGGIGHQVRILVLVVHGGDGTLPLSPSGTVWRT